MLHNDFEQKILTWITVALDQGVDDFGDLVRALPGVSPPEIAAALPSVPNVPAPLRGLSRTNHLIFGRTNGSVPHPLDYDWRFSPRAISLLASEALRCCPSSGTIGLFGCPSLARSSELLTRKLWLLDRNAHEEAVGGNCRTAAVDLVCDAIPPVAADIAIVDPPWYPEIQLAFLWAAAMVLPVGGVVLSSGPPVGSRPSAADDQETLIARARDFGLKAVSTRRGILPYLTPPFEAAAFRAAGTPPFPVDWRRGDLVTFRKCARTDAERPRVSSPKIAWSEYNVEGVQIRVRVTDPSEDDPSLYALVPDNVLPTVSHRSPIREEVAVWTSGNRVFGSRNPAVVAATLASMESASRCAEQGCPQLREALQRIVECERREYIDHGGEPWSCNPGSVNFDTRSIECS